MEGMGWSITGDGSTRDPPVTVLCPTRLSLCPRASRSTGQPLRDRFRGCSTKAGVPDRARAAGDVPGCRGEQEHWRVYQRLPMGLLGSQLEQAAMKPWAVPGELDTDFPQLTLPQQQQPSLSPGQWRVGTFRSAWCHLSKYKAVRQVKNTQGRAT